LEVVIKGTGMNESDVAMIGAVRTVSRQMELGSNGETTLIEILDAVGQRFFRLMICRCADYNVNASHAWVHFWIGSEWVLLHELLPMSMKTRSQASEGFTNRGLLQDVAIFSEDRDELLRVALHVVPLRASRRMVTALENMCEKARGYLKWSRGA
jgi:hypothetical protein